MDEAVLNKLEWRLGRLHAKLRLGIETDHEAQIIGQGINFFHIENWYSIHSVMRTTLKLMGLYWRGRRNADQIQIRHNYIGMESLPSRFNGFTLLHISDLHVEMNEGAMRRLAQLLPELTYDVRVLTGDYRSATFGPFDTTLEGLARVRSHLKDPVYGVLGNHDTIRMVPELEEMGIRMLLNEWDNILRGDQTIYLAGIDDAHYYRVDNIEKAASEIPENGFSILLSHTPEIYRQAAHAGFDLLLSGHTHGRADLSTRVYPDHSIFGSSPAYGLGTLETPRYGWLHLGRCRNIYCSRPHQLSAGNYAASSPMPPMNGHSTITVEKSQQIALEIREMEM